MFLSLPSLIRTKGNWFGLCQELYVLKRASKLILLAMTAILAGCTAQQEKALDPAKNMQCKNMETSLKGSVFVQVRSPLGGLTYKLDRANSVGQQNLAALHAIYAACQAWARESITDEEFSKRTAEYAGVYSAYRAVDAFGKSLREQQKEVDNRIQILSDASNELGIRLGESELQKSRAFAIQVTEISTLFEASNALQSELERVNIELDENSKRRSQFIRSQDVANLRAQVDHLEVVSSEYDQAISDIRSELPIARIAQYSNVVLVSVFFDTLSWDISRNGRDTLNDLTSQVARTDVVIRVYGFADERGTSEGNFPLSKNRARVVAEYLQSVGIDVTSYTGLGEGTVFGDSHPANRRVLIEVSTP